MSRVVRASEGASLLTGLLVILRAAGLRIGWLWILAPLWILVGGFLIAFIWYLLTTIVLLTIKDLRRRYVGRV